MGTLHEDLCTCTYMIIALSVLLRMRNVLDKFTEKIKIHIINIFQKPCRLWDNIHKNKIYFCVSTATVITQTHNNVTLHKPTTVLHYTNPQQCYNIFDKNKTQIFSQTQLFLVDISLLILSLLIILLTLLFQYTKIWFLTHREHSMLPLETKILQRRHCCLTMAIKLIALLTLLIFYTKIQ
jgi:hypothetical protein